LDAVVNIGARKCSELKDYCRLGAKQITLAEPSLALAASLKKLGSYDGKIYVKQVAVAGKSSVRKAHIYKNTRPDSTAREELYLLEPIAVHAFQPSLQVIRSENIETCTISEICENICLSGSNGFLVLELGGLEIEALKVTPKILIRKFGWIAVGVSERPLFEYGATSQSVKTTLREF
jgi:hypothetical protein